MKIQIKNYILSKFFNIISKIYKKIFIRKKFYILNNFFYRLTLHGIGILNYKNYKISGEKYFLKKILPKTTHKTVFDIGGNIGNYSKLIKEINSNTKVYSFEPHPKTFQILQKNAKKNNFKTFNFGFGNKDEKTKIYDYKNNDGSSHASTYSNVITTIHKKEVTNHEITISKIDTFVKNNNINKIDLLKIDTEGNEFKVIEGAQKTLGNNIIDVIHFEFNEMNVVSRVFFKDFYDLLKNFTFYRMFPDGLVPLKDYNPLLCEIFAYQNIVAIRNNINIKF